MVKSGKLTSGKQINKPIKILGIFFTYNNGLREKLNFENVKRCIETTLNLWKWRNLTIFGKVQIIKSFVLPKISYRTNVINLSEQKIKEINHLLFRFLWKGKDKIKRLAVINEYD